MSYLLFPFVLLVVGQTNPSCSPYVVNDGEGNTYVYDLAPFEMPDNSTMGFIQGPRV
jgi:hypothetical protein